MKARGVWGTRYGFYLVAIGSAFGLGNLWRFPAVVVENGGGAFVLLYVFLVLLVGFPLLLSELLLGKLTRRSLLSALLQIREEKKTSPKVTWCLRWTGRLSMMACLGLLSYYAVISGWVLHFFLQFLWASVTGGDLGPSQTLNELRSSGLLQVALTGVHLLFVTFVVARGVEHGVERWLSFTMPVFVALTLWLLMKAVQLPNAEEAFRYLLYPDFSKLTASSVIEAFGHMCFTLSIGFGTMVTFGSYLKGSTRLSDASLRVISLDTILSLLGGFIIFPIVFSSNFHVWGPEVLFQTVPRLVAPLTGGMVFGLLFFLCLYLAALGASIGLMEVIVSNWLDRRKKEVRRSVSLKSGALVFVIALFPALSSSLLRYVNFHGLGVLELLDSILITWILPFTAVAIGFTVALFMSDKELYPEFETGVAKETRKLVDYWRSMVWWFAPAVLFIALVLRLVF